MCKSWSAVATYLLYSTQLLTSYIVPPWMFSEGFRVNSALGKLLLVWRNATQIGTGKFTFEHCPLKQRQKPPPRPPIYFWVQFWPIHALQLQVTKPKTSTACAVSPLLSPSRCSVAPPLKGAVKVEKIYSFGLGLAYWTIEVNYSSWFWTGIFKDFTITQFPGKTCTDIVSVELPFPQIASTSAKVPVLASTFYQLSPWMYYVTYKYGRVQFD